MRGNKLLAHGRSFDHPCWFSVSALSFAATASSAADSKGAPGASKEVALALKVDGSAVDPVAFRSFVRENSTLRAELEAASPALAKALAGDDTDALQTALRYLAVKAALPCPIQPGLDAQRASHALPRDPSALYAAMNAAGLQYGPAFRLLTQVFVPAPEVGSEETQAASASAAAA